MSGPVDEALRIPVAHGFVVRRHVVFDGGIAVGRSVSFVECDALVFVEDFYHRVGVNDPNLVTSVTIGHSVVVFIVTEMDVVVESNLE
ncbi:hypothetical protein GWN42_13905 [candidate division KSB1 bacterium]|nr:hypothetical protein [candidate division KSB1 bacterium]NIU26653.1 hypothetical protein [candidate division KSB1 bacterium]NIV93849.1 hypothetical protein [candidate division KSB1 bacterium]NIW20523.1 hypothetical protein [candidate division KSB1 bacterium]NIW68058.1 hypothetical protein [candidate division KSB1 bacterium]